jgi:hypothetical protein
MSVGSVYNSVLEIPVFCLVIHKWEPDIYIRFLPVLHLQCVLKYSVLKSEIPIEIGSCAVFIFFTFYL